MRVKIPSFASIATLITLSLMLVLQTAALGAPPSFTLTGTMNAPRESHTATRLQNGNVLVVGGHKQSGELATAQLYDGAWEPESADTMAVERKNHTATLLSDGTVLVTGGQRDGKYLNSAELYHADGTRETTDTIANMKAPRGFHTATLLPNGKVLVVGAVNNIHSITAELYDPIANTWTKTGDMKIGRSSHTATLLNNGKVLVIGGTTFGSATATAELYDPETGTWTLVRSMEKTRTCHTATLLNDGKVLVAGGWDGTSFLGSAELYDPATDTWTYANRMATLRALHAATLLSDGTVLVTGGATDINIATNKAEIYDPGSNTWSSAATMNVSRFSHTATWLTDGTILVAGGYDKTFKGDANKGYRDTAELYDYGATVPVVTITANSAGLPYTQQPNFDLSTSTGGDLEYKLDYDSYAGHVSPYNYTVPEALSGDVHTLTVRTKEVGGVVDVAPATYTWTVKSLFTIKSSVLSTKEDSVVISGTKEGGSHLVVAGGTCNFTAESTDAASSWSCTASGYPLGQATTLTFTATLDAKTTILKAVINYSKPPAAVITNKPNATTKAGTYKLYVGGDRVTHYKWKLKTTKPDHSDTSGALSAEISVSTPFSVTTKKDGYTYDVYVIGKDASGTWQELAGADVATWTVDTSKPETSTITDNSDGTVSFTAGVNDTFECKIDKGSYDLCASPFTLPTTNMKVGRHKLYVRAKSPAGNYDAKPEIFPWTIPSL